MIPTESERLTQANFNSLVNKNNVGQDIQRSNAAALAAMCIADKYVLS
jgi:hypothetical protein